MAKGYKSGFGLGDRHREESKQRMSRAKAGKSVNAGESNPQWRGGRYTDKSGYVYLWVGAEHPMAQKSGYALEHRLVMSGVVGRALLSDETVHHIDGNRANNSPDNLQLRKGRHGKGVALMCGDCGSINILSLGLDAPAHKAMSRASY